MPYQKILELVENNKLDITTVNLAQITDEFIKHVRELETTDPQLLADFVVVAGKLILIKSKALLPSLALTEEEEGEIADLQDRLRLYQEYKNAGQHIKNLWQDRPAVLARSYMSHYGVFFYPPQSLTVSQLLEPLKNLAEELGKLTASWQNNTQTVKIKIISIEQKVGELLKRLTSSRQGKFSQLAGVVSRGEIVATFLAVLNLLKDNIITVKQDKCFEDIYVKKI